MNRIQGSNNIYWLIYCLLLISSCGKKTNDKSQGLIELKKNEIVIGHGDLLLNNRSSLSKITGRDSLLSLSQATKQLVIFDLNTKLPVYNIEVSFDGPNSFDIQTSEMDILGERLYVLSNNFFSVYTLEGKLIERYDPDDLTGMNTDFKIFDFELINSDLVLFNKVPFQAFGSKFMFKNPQNIFMTFDLKTKAINELNIYPPKEALVDVPDQGYYNDFSFHDMVYSNDSIIYSFRFSAKTYVYQLSKDKTTVLDTKSSFVSNLREPTTPEVKRSRKWLEYEMSGSKFSKWSKDNKSGYYARIHSELRPLPNGDLYNFKYLMVLNPKLEVVAEIEIEARVREPAIFGNGKIYIQRTDQVIEDAHQYVVYEVVTN